MMSRPTTARKLPPYRGPAYWERERPQEAQTDRIALAYYPQAGKLQISLLWRDRETGEKRRGRTVTIDQEDLALHPEAGELLAKVIADWR